MSHSIIFEFPNLCCDNETKLYNLLASVSCLESMSGFGSRSVVQLVNTQSLFKAQPKGMICIKSLWAAYFI